MKPLILVDGGSSQGGEFFEGKKLFLKCFFSEKTGQVFLITTFAKALYSNFMKKASRTGTINHCTDPLIDRCNC